MKQNYVLLFDFDGTLVNSMPVFAETMLRVINEAAVSYPENIIEILTPLGYHGSAEYMINTLGINESADALVTKMHEYAYDGYANDITLKEGVGALLTSLKDSGYSLNVLTASPHKMLDVCLKRNGVWELFDNVWSCEDFGTTKSDPEIYRAAARRLGTDVSHVAFFDDNVIAVETARRAGAFTFGVYDESGTAFTEKLKATAHCYLDTMVDAKKTVISVLSKHKKGDLK